MDEINDFFNFTKEPKLIEAPRGYITDAVYDLPENDGNNSICKYDRKHLGTEYAEALVGKECKRLAELDLSNQQQYNRRARENDLNDISDSSDDDDVKDDYQMERSRMHLDYVYKSYTFKREHDKNLSIHDKKREILEIIRKNFIVVLEGNTGCGKTTQIPQYILDDAYLKGEKCNIVCTQPRRIAAISVARRVCDERKCEIGSLIGYQVGIHSKVSEDTRLLYCTTGVLLRKLIQKKSMQPYTHIILDEVHERGAEMDLLLIVLRCFLGTNSGTSKIILMSATIDSLEFSNYFKICNKPAPILKVDNRRFYEIEQYYLCDLDPSKKYDVNFNECNISKETYMIALELITAIDHIEKREAHLNNLYDIQQSSILVFLPGLNEINEMYQMIEDLNQKQSKKTMTKLKPIRLHSLIPPDEQIKIFEVLPGDMRKVILSTNLAESSITVPDVKYVIDFCLTKSLIVSSETGFTSLQLHWASRSQCRQRSGRTGRVINGRAYRLVTRKFYEQHMHEYSVPEILCSPLEIVVLKVKLLDIGSPSDILSLSLSPPNLSDIHNTILALKEVGALYNTVNGIPSTYDGDITYMGRIMAHLPLSVQLSRLIIIGNMLSVLEEAIIIAAGLGVRAIFHLPILDAKQFANACNQQLLCADGSGSDLFCILNVYRIWMNMRQYNIKDNDSEISWANRYLINLSSLKEMHLLILKIDEHLKHFNWNKMHSQHRVYWTDREKTIILKIVIAGAFYPHYFVKNKYCSADRERDICSQIGQNDPFNTVYFKNFNNTCHIGPLYSQSIKELFKSVRIQPKNITIQFPSACEKVLVKFKPKEIHNDHHLILRVPGNVNPDVYKAIRMRLCGVPTDIAVMNPNLAERYAEKHGLRKAHERLNYNRLNEEYTTSLTESEIEIEPPPKELCNETLRLKGPYSPLETIIHSVMRGGASQCIHIERNSVNCVLLDTDSQNLYDRYFVASTIGESLNKNIILHSTTLMPNIHGLGALATMLFCPTMQVKRDKNCTKYIGILAGLGYDPETYKPLYGEHDIYINLDVELDLIDFQMANRLRYLMDSILFTIPHEESPCLTLEQIGECKAQIKQTLMKLLTKQRKYIEPCGEISDSWESENPAEVYESVNIYGNRSIFPMLTALSLYKEG